MSGDESLRQSYSEINGKERAWRRHDGILFLSGWAARKAGLFVILNSLVTLFLFFGISYFLSLTLLFPIMVVFDLEFGEFFQPQTIADILLHTLAFTFLVGIAPGAVMQGYFRLGDELEKIARDEGTFWRD